jgi:sugar-phosphatase
MNQMVCDAILFDLDGVLVDSIACVEAQWHRWAAKHGFDVETLLAVAHGRRTAETIATIAPHLDCESEAAELERGEETDTTGVYEVRGALELLSNLPADAWAVATSGNRTTALTRILHVGLPEPAALITADDVSRGKPDPEPYLCAARRLGVPASGCVVVEDTPVGVHAARAAGMRVIAVASTHPPDAIQNADMVLDQLLDLVVRVNPVGGDSRLVVQTSKDRAGQSVHCEHPGLRNHGTVGFDLETDMGIRAVVLDMDGLMLDTEPIYKAAWQQACAELGFDLDDQSHLRFIGRPTSHCERELIQQFGSEFPLSRFRTRWSELWRTSVNAGGIPTKPGLLAFLSFLDEYALSSAVATSSDGAYTELSLRSAGLLDRFDAIVTGEQVTRGKPAPDIYLEAAARLGLDPAECVALEDSDAGVLAASAAGMVTLCVPDLKPPSEAAVRAASSVLSSLDDARKWIGALVGNRRAAG